ncbi:MAG TPA: hypothetical protein VNR86_04005, partial [Sphingomicrobium sp.]|nr:hypothetical protein [Sphingomicrobium sp.]
EKPKATLFPDALPYDFQLGWPDGSWEPDRGWPAWRETATDVMADSDAVITFSRHVADRHAGPLCGVPIDKIRVIPLAPPDLAPQLPFLKDRRQTPASREKAANLLRSFADDRGLHYLKDFPFEEVDFVTAATQDRPSKNLGLTADAVRFLVREKRQSMKLILTAQLHFDADWSRLPILVSKDQLHRDILSLPDLPRAVHAALFHCATIVVHSSFFEGIVGALPFYEAASVGTPSLLARGPHVDELLALEPDLKSFTYDPYDFRQLAGLIGMIAADREAAVQEQAGIFERLSRNTWSDVASGYAEAALEGGLRQRER